MNNQDYYNKEYVPQVNKIGKITGYLGVLLSFTPALVLAVVYGILPKPAALLTAFISGASAFGVLWFVEPISYFPVVGAAGTYMAFLSGNISNMRIPCASMAQVAADVEPGTEKGSVVATLGMAVSIVINVSVLTIGAILGTSVLSMLPDTIKAALNYLLPALFGALLVQFGMKMKKHSVIMVVFAIILYFMIGMGYFNWLPGASNWLGTLGCVFVSIAVGMGNYKDSKMQVLAEKGNGNHAYIDNLQEANRVLVNEFGATMHTVAKDVKLQIEFNPSQVQAYRLIGYESRLLKDEDFNNDAKDAGEMGAGHTVTAFYEVVPAGIKSDFTGKVDDLKYQKTKPAPAVTNNSKELLTVKLRYKAPDGNTSKKIEQPLIDDKKEKVSSDFRFASAVAMFGQLLRDSDFKGDATYDKVISLAKTSLDNDEKGYRREFIRLAETAEGLAKD